MSRIDHVLIAPGAPGGDRLLCYGAASAGAALALHQALRADLPWRAVVVVTIIALDLYGGAVVNATAAAKRTYHAPGRTARHHLIFVGIHVQPFLMAWFVPAFTWDAALTIYLIAWGGAAALQFAPPGVRRPAAFAIAVLGLTLVTVPQAVAWFTPVLLIKLLLSYLQPAEAASAHRTACGAPP
ncbi:hypothetical protein [Nonomuraea diastatica]|uniref:Uncharacterized protein n=1 Tax=Nonomuraea diastatica TaxID=1848329 RepID=A0A4V2YFT9_9ACTN|nr:hypothetical protein [Nonomuraea diastatica]TDD24477.1 hypothetical protein E1294_05825 [Nonomuraea diastatica]